MEDEKQTITKADVGTISAAVGTAASGTGEITAKMMEDAMVQAINKCGEDGISDPDAIREAMRAAREGLKAKAKQAAEVEAQ